MELWLAALLLIVFTGGFLVFFFYSSRKKKIPFIVFSCILGFVSLALVIYIVLTFLLLDGIS